MDLRKLLIAGISIVGVAAFEAWLQNAGYSQSVMALTAVFSCVVVALELIGWRRAARYTARYRPMGIVLAFVIVGSLGALGWAALESLASKTDEGLNHATGNDVAIPSPPQNSTPPLPAKDEPPPNVGLRSSGPNSPNIVGNNNTVILGQSSGQRPSAHIISLVVETRLTALLREGAEIPPASVDFTPVGDGSDAHLVGPGGDFVLNYVSPTRFRQLDGHRIVVINTFAAGAASPLLNRPIETLNSLEQIVAHPVTIVYGRALAGATLWEVTIHVNGRGPWYYSYKLPGEATPSGQVPVFRIPLNGLLERVRGV